MAAVNVTFPGNLAQVKTAADLRSVPSTLLPLGALFLVNGLEGLFEYDPGSLAPDDGKDVLRPVDKTPGQFGRWIRNVDGLATGPEGPTGPANSTYTTRRKLEQAPVTNRSYNFAPDTDDTSGWPAGAYFFTPGDFSGAQYAADFVSGQKVKLDAVPLTTGALVRQGAQSISYQADPGAPARSQADVNANSVNVHDFRYAVETDDLSAWNRARTKGKPIRFVAGMGAGPGGVYLLNFAPLTSNLEIYGDGAGTVIRPTIAANGNIFLGNSGAADAFIDNVTIRDLTLYGRVEEAGFSEPEHLIRASGFRNLKLFNLRLLGFRGDGIYIGSGEVQGQQRFNIGVTIRSCYFDGINNENRNAISVIDGRRIWIEHCEFRRCTRPNMPGPIDFEPDGQPYHLHSDIIVHNNIFDACGGNLGQICFLFPAPVQLPSRISIKGNKFTNYIGTGADIAVDMRRQIVPENYSMAMVIDDNQGANGTRPIDIVCGIGITVTASNQFENYLGGNLIGFTGPDNIVRDIRLGGIYTVCGKSGASGTLINRATNLEVSATFDRCGQATSGGFAVQFGNTSSAGVVLRNAKIIGAAGQTVAINNAGHTFTPATNKMINVDTGGLLSQFQAQTESRATLTLTNGWADGDATNSPTIAYKSGEGRIATQVNLAGGSPLTNGASFATWPVGFRPSAQVFAVLNSGTGFATVRVDPSGVGILIGTAPSASLRGTITFNGGQ